MSVITATASAATELSPFRLQVMRGGYLVIGVGLVLVKWPLLPEAHTMPLYEGVTLCLLTALSLLAFVGAWRPVRMLPLLVFEVLWKVLWLSAVALPRALAGELHGAFVDVAVNCSLLVVIAAAVPWRHAWRILRHRWPRSGDPCDHAASGASWEGARRREISDAGARR